MEGLSSRFFPTRVDRLSTGSRRRGRHVRRPSPGARGASRLMVSALLGALLAMTAGVALAVHDNGLFELDENAVEDALEPGDDWDDGGGAALESRFEEDAFESPGDSTCLAGSSHGRVDGGDGRSRPGRARPELPVRRRHKFN